MSTLRQPSALPEQAERACAAIERGMETVLQTVREEAKKAVEKLGSSSTKNEEQTFMEVARSLFRKEKKAESDTAAQFDRIAPTLADTSRRINTFYETIQKKLLDALDTEPRSKVEPVIQQLNEQSAGDPEYYYERVRENIPIRGDSKDSALQPVITAIADTIGKIHQLSKRIEPLKNKPEIWKSPAVKIEQKHTHTPPEQSKELPEPDNETGSNDTDDQAAGSA